MAVIPPPILGDSGLPLSTPTASPGNIRSRFASSILALFAGIQYRNRIVPYLGYPSGLNQFGSRIPTTLSFPILTFSAIVTLLYNFQGAELAPVTFQIQTLTLWPLLSPRQILGACRVWFHFGYHISTPFLGITPGLCFAVYQHQTKGNKTFVCTTFYTKSFSLINLSSRGTNPKINEKRIEARETSIRRPARWHKVEPDPDLVLKLFQPP